MKNNKVDYTCTEYRMEMILLGLRRRLLQEHLSEEERGNLKKEIRALEERMGMV